MTTIDFNAAMVRSNLTGLPLSDVLLDMASAERNRELARSAPYVEPMRRVYRGVTIFREPQDDGSNRYVLSHPQGRPEDLGSFRELEPALYHIDALIARGFIPKEW